jgi:signal transduction histidine kinase
LALIGANLTSRTSGPRWVLVAAHLAVLTVALLIVLRRSRAWPLLLLIYAVLPLDYYAVVDANSALCFVTIWTSLLTTAVPVLLLPSGVAAGFSLLAVAVTVGALLVWHREWGWQLPVATGVTAIVLMVAALMLMRQLRSFARQTDERQAAAVREHHRLTVQRRVAKAAAEDARLMHDTLINTLAVIARGSRVIRGQAQFVRERCALDVEAVEEMLDSQQKAGRREFRPRAITVPAGVHLRRTGLSDHCVQRLFADLPARVLRAVHGAVLELVHNAVKHSGTSNIGLDFRHDYDILTVSISDDGCGFDGQLPAGHGLAESVVARAHDVGVEVEIRTAPGAGTTVTLMIPLDDALSDASEEDASPPDAGDIVAKLRHAACWSWATIMVGFGVAAALLNRPATAPPVVAMVAMVGALSALAWWVCRDGRTLPAWAVGLVLLGIPATFLAGAAAIDFGRVDINAWPAIVMTALPVVLLVTCPRKTAFFAGIGLLAVTAAVTSYLVWSADPTAGTVVLAGAAVPLAVLTAWLVLHRAIDEIDVQHQRTLRKLIDDRMERDARDKIASARSRWTHAGAQASLDVLRRIATGQVDPADVAVRRECGEAERYLRQLLLLDPEIVWMSPWIGRAIANSRARSVSMNLRGCTEDAPNEQVAAALGGTILACIDAVPPAAELSVGLFPTERGPRLVIAGPSGHLHAVCAPTGLPRTATFAYRNLEDHDVVELAVPGRVDDEDPVLASASAPGSPTTHRAGISARVPGGPTSRQADPLYQPATLP